MKNVCMVPCVAVSAMMCGKYCA